MPEPKLFYDHIHRPAAHLSVTGPDGRSFVLDSEANTSVAHNETGLRPTGRSTVTARPISFFPNALIVHELSRRTFHLWLAPDGLFRVIDDQTGVVITDPAGFHQALWQLRQCLTHKRRMRRLLEDLAGLPEVGKLPLHDLPEGLSRLGITPNPERHAAAQAELDNVRFDSDRPTEVLSYGLDTAMRRWSGDNTDFWLAAEDTTPCWVRYGPDVGRDALLFTSRLTNPVYCCFSTPGLIFRFTFDAHGLDARQRYDERWMKLFLYLQPTGRIGVAHLDTGTHLFTVATPEEAVRVMRQGRVEGHLSGRSLFDALQQRKPVRQLRKTSEETAWRHIWPEYYPHDVEKQPHVLRDYDPDHPDSLPIPAGFMFYTQKLIDAHVRFQPKPAPEGLNPAYNLQHQRFPVRARFFDVNTERFFLYLQPTGKIGACHLQTGVQLAEGESIEETLRALRFRIYTNPEAYYKGPVYFLPEITQKEAFKTLWPEAADACADAQ